MTERVSAGEAAARLGVKRETVYAYVSRGFLHSERAIDGKTSTFDAAEVDRLRRRHAGGKPGRLEVPVASSITEVTDGRVSYRGQPLDQIVAAGHHYEAVAELLWTGELDAAGFWSTPPRVASVVRRAVDALPEHATATDRMMAGVVAAGASDAFRDDRSTEGVTTTGRVLIRAIVDSLPSRIEETNERLASLLWAALSDRHARQWTILDTVMVCLVDHGMATSTLAGRLAASTRAGPHAVLLAGLGAVAGPLHGGASRLVHGMFADAEQRGADAALAEVLHRDGKIPGLGHFIHKTSDPRYEIMAGLIAGSALPNRRLDVIAEVLARTSERVPAAPNVDMALGGLTFAAGMNSDAGELIFAIARSAGWLAHALEEYDEAPIRFRPIGRYVRRRGD